jgi:NAD dependent epimerase/dehydratase
MDWSHQTVLVTGAGGFIGSHLTERLVSLGARTRALVRYNSANSWGWLGESSAISDIEVTVGDICDRDSIRSAIRGVDIIFHLAALIAIPFSYRAPFSYIRTNVEGTLNVLQTAVDSDVKLVIHTSTSEVYGTARYVPIDEKHPLQGQSPYSASKIGADAIVESYHLSFGLPVAILRPFNTYGPRQSARAIIPTIVTQVLTNSAIHLGNLEPTRDFNYIADTVEGFIRMAGSQEAVGQTINVGSGNEISIGDLAGLIMELVGRKIPIVCDNQRVRPSGSEVQRLCADNCLASRLMGWKPRFGLKEGLGQTVEWVEKNLERYRLGSYTI